MLLNPHAPFVTAADLAVALVIAILISGVWLDDTSQHRRLRAFAAGGGARRSGRAAAEM